MIRVVNVRESVLVTLSVVSDMAYAWVAMADYAPLMRVRIQRNPFCVLKLRARMREAAIGGVYDIIYEGIEDAEHGQDEARSPRSSTLSGASGGEWPSPERRCSFESVGEAEDDGEAVWWSTSLVPTRKRGIIDAPALQV